MKKTKKEYEKYLNEIYTDIYGYEEALDKFSYLASEKVIANNYFNHTLGQLFRLKDSIAFNVGYSDWAR